MGATVVVPLPSSPKHLDPRTGGEHGIRTHGALADTLDFESSTFNRSVSSPRRNLPKQEVLSMSGTMTPACTYRLEKAAQLTGAFVPQNAHLDLETMIEAAVASDLVQGADSARFGVVTTVYDTRNPTVYQRACTHRAGLQCHVDGCPIEPPRTLPGGRSAQGDHLSVGAGVPGRLAQVVAAGHDRAIDDHDSTDRNLAPGAGLLRLPDGLTHEPRIVFA